MSVESVARALSVNGVGGTEKLVLIGIANHDGDGGAWPSIDTLARYASCGRRHVQRIIADLVAAGLITVELNAGGTEKTRNDHRPNRYTLQFPPVDNTPNGVVHTSPRSPDGVTFSAPRGDILGSTGWSTDHPNHPLEPSYLERAKIAAVPVDNSRASRRACITCDGPIEPERILKTRCANCQTAMDATRALRLATEQGIPT